MRVLRPRQVAFFGVVVYISIHAVRENSSEARLASRGGFKKRVTALERVGKSSLAELLCTWEFA